VPTSLVEGFSVSILKKSKLLLTLPFLVFIVFGATFELPDEVTALVQNCVTSYDGEISPGVKKVCFPGAKAKLDGHKYSLASVELGSFLKTLAHLPKDQPEACMKRVAIGAMAFGKKTNMATLSWADALIFSNDYKKPALLLNTDPTTGKGYIAVLPKYDFCEKNIHNKILADLTELQRQFDDLIKIYEEDAEGKSALARVFANPNSIFKTYLEPECHCPGVILVGEIKVRENAPVKASAPDRASTLDANGLVNNTDLLDQIDEHTKAALDYIKNSSNPYISNTAQAIENLKQKGIDVSVKGITVNGRVVDSIEMLPSEYREMAKTSQKTGMGMPMGGGMGTPIGGGMMTSDELEKFNQAKNEYANSLGIDGVELDYAITMQMQLNQSVIEARYENDPISDNEEYFMGMNFEIQKATLPDGCKRVESGYPGMMSTYKYVNCFGNFDAQNEYNQMLTERYQPQ